MISQNGVLVKRPYPTDAKGNIDEWAAVISKQAEIARFQKERE